VKRLLTAAVGVPLALAAIFRLPGWAFFLVAALILTGAAYEFSRLARSAAPRSPWWLLPVLVPAAAALLARGLSDGVAVDGFHALALGALAAIGVGTAVLFAGAPAAESLMAMGGLAFAIPYFAVPIAALYRLQQHDPWVLFLLLAIVWLGDTAAFYVGSAWGRHKLAPAVSPNKSWEGAIAGFAVSLASVAIWGVWREGTIAPELLVIGAATALASQVGDLVESLFKRGAGVKDSGDLLPGHGGVLDRMDAMLFAAPVMLLLLYACGREGAP
jgi:phosphatidate cytidylyltransferase